MTAITQRSEASFFEESRVLITGGTGSLGTRLAQTILRQTKSTIVVIYSRDEFKQSKMREMFSQSDHRRLRFFLGDVRDIDRLKRGMEQVQYVVHAAALKQIPAAEYNPFEFIKTNVLGAQNVIDAAIDIGVKRVVALSTDKAAAPINLYGATKLCSDKLFVAANNFKGLHEIKFSVVRYGNVMGSRGSVIPLFLERRKTGVLPITDERMTRFNISLDEGVALVLYAFENMWGGEIFVPRLPSYRILDLANAIGPECEHLVVGIRPGEKLHEEMITEMDSVNTIELDSHFVLLPYAGIWDRAEYMKTFNGRPCPLGFRYSSGENTDWLTVDQIRELIRKHVDPSSAFPAALT